MRFVKPTKRTLKYYLIRLIRVRDNHLRVQRGIAIGIAIHSIPLFGISLLVALGLAFPLRANKIAVTIANLMSSPFAIPIYGLDALFMRFIKHHFHIPYYFSFPIGVILSFALLSVISYLLAGVVMGRIRRSHEAKRDLRRKRMRTKDTDDVNAIQMRVSQE